MIFNSLYLLMLTKGYILKRNRLPFREMMCVWAEENQLRTKLDSSIRSQIHSGFYFFYSYWNRQIVYVQSLSHWLCNTSGNLLSYLLRQRSIRSENGTNIHYFKCLYDQSLWSP